MSSVIKPGAKFKNIAPMPSKVENLGDKDFLVLLAGTNDVACNEAVNILRSLKRTLEVATTRLSSQFLTGMI